MLASCQRTQLQISCRADLSATRSSQDCCHSISSWAALQNDGQEPHLAVLPQEVMRRYYSLMCVKQDSNVARHKQKKKMTFPESQCRSSHRSSLSRVCSHWQLSPLLLPRVASSIPPNYAAWRRCRSAKGLHRRQVYTQGSVCPRARTASRSTL